MPPRLLVPVAAAATPAASAQLRVEVPAGVVVHRRGTMASAVR